MSIFCIEDMNILMNLPVFHVQQSKKGGTGFSNRAGMPQPCRCCYFKQYAPVIAPPCLYILLQCGGPNVGLVMVIDI